MKQGIHTKILFQAMKNGQRVGRGHNSVAHLHEKIVHKVITGERVLDKNKYQFTQELAMKTRVHLESFIEMLRKTSIPIPLTNTYVFTMGDQHGLWIEQAAVGPNLADIIKEETNPESVLQLCQQVRHNFINPMELKAKGNDGYFNFGMDLKTDNFCLSPENELLLVDLFPPHIWVDKGADREAITEMFPVPRRAYEAKLWLLFTKEGLCVTALSQMGRLRTELWPYFVKGLECEELVRDLLGGGVKGLKFEGFEDAYRARVMGCAFAHQNCVSAAQISHLFDLTHVEDDSVRVDEIKDCLRRLKKGEV